MSVSRPFSQGQLSGIPATLLALLAALGLPACGEGEPADLRVRWHFADGRRCDSAGTPVVVIEVAGTRSAFDCPLGEDAEVTLEGLPTGGHQLDIGARTAEGATLYQGAVSVEVRADGRSRVDAALHYTGGQSD